VNDSQAANSGYNYSISDVPQPNSNIGNLIDQQGNIVGTVNYLTGAYAFTPAGLGTIPANATIYASVVPYQSSRPTDVIFYNQQITFRPVPQQVYQVEFQISQQPTQLIESRSAPELDEWYLFICAGASKLIYADFPDDQGLASLMPVWQEIAKQGFEVHGNYWKQSIGLDAVIINNFLDININVPVVCGELKIEHVYSAVCQFIKWYKEKGILDLNF